MNIAICDNEEMFVKNISGLLEEYLNENKLQYSIDMYSSGSELIGLKDKIVNYDIVFLDINMTGIDNIKVAEWIRMYSDRVIIISITLMSDYNIQGYKYDVFRCVLKDSMDLKGSIYECMNAVLYKLNYINSDKRIISCDSGSKEVDVSKIIYIESSGHKVTYHIHGKEFGDYVVKSKLDDIENELKEYKYLLRVHQSYIVNMMYVNNISSYRVYLKNGIDLGVPKSRKEMYFSIGGHPAFVCGENAIGAQVRFETKENGIQYHLLSKDGLVQPDIHYMPITNKNVTLTENFFDKDAYIIENNDIKCVSLCKDCKPVVEVIFDTPVFGLWSSAGKGVPFVCIEPWYGRADAVDFNCRLTDREWGNKLAVGKVFSGGYKMRFM